jgi:O-antigen ligase
MVAVAVCAALWFFRGRARAFRYVIVGALAVTLIPLIATETLPPSVVNRFVPTLGTTGYDSSADERLESIRFGWATFEDHPVLGVGPEMSPKYNIWDIPHESLVYVLSEIGLLGGCLFLALNIMTIWRAVVAVRRQSDTWTQSVQTACLVGPACWFIFGLIGGLEFTMNAALVWIGITYASLALASAVILPDSATNPAFGIRHRRSRIATRML